MSFTFGNRPEDVITDSRGNTLSGVTITLYASEADASAQLEPLGSATATDGVWSFTADETVVWARTPGGTVYPIEAVGSHDAATAAVLETASAARTAGDSRWQVEKVHRSAGAADDAPALQAFLTGLTAGDEVVLKGEFTLGSTITLAVEDVKVRLAPGTVLAPTSATVDCIAVTAANVTLEGGTIQSPASWDGSNVPWTYAVVNVTADRFTARGVTLTNVPKVGFGVRTSDALITGCRIDGNFPSGSYTGVETGHFGIQFDPPAGDNGGAGIVSDCHISECVQGIQLGNTGAGNGYGYVITGNNFYGCHNHGVYQSHGDGGVIGANAFHRCQLPIVIAGSGHSVTGNSLYSSGTGTTLDWAGISVRDATDCVISGNTIVGDANASAVGIAVDSLNETALRRNVVSNNVVTLAGSGSTNSAVRIGSSLTEVSEDNRVTGNVISSPGAPSIGVVAFNMKAAFYGYGNSATGNTVVVTGNAHGITLTRQKGMVVSGNVVRNNYSAGAGVTSIHIYLIDSDLNSVSGNVSVNQTGTGTNVTVHAVRTDASSTGNILGPNSTALESGLAGSSALIDGGSGNVAGVTVGSAAAAPAAGTWTAGRVLFNSAPAVGSPKGWVCTVAGTPGTWVSLGNL